jgi:hypothetical protein
MTLVSEKKAKSFFYLDEFIGGGQARPGFGHNSGAQFSESGPELSEALERLSKYTPFQVHTASSPSSPSQLAAPTTPNLPGPQSASGLLSPTQSVALSIDLVFGATDQEVKFGGSHDDTLLFNPNFGTSNLPAFADGPQAADSHADYIDVASGLIADFATLESLLSEALGAHVVGVPDTNATTPDLPLTGPDDFKFI